MDGDLRREPRRGQPRRISQGVRMMNPILARVLIFIALVATAMAIIIGAASVGHAAECLPSARAVWAAHDGAHATWNVVGDVKCYRVGYGRHHHQVMGATKLRAQVSGSSVRDSSAVGVALRPLEQRVRFPSAAPASFRRKEVMPLEQRRMRPGSSGRATTYDAGPR